MRFAVAGRAAAMWRLAAGKVVLEPLDRLAAEDASALEADAEDVERFLAGEAGRAPDP